MHIKDIVNYVKNEINFSREFCEDNVFVTLRIEPIERIIENLEQKDKDNLSYARDLAEIRYEYNTLKKKIENKLNDIDKALDEEYEKSVAYMQLQCARNQIKELLGE